MSTPDAGDPGEAARALARRLSVLEEGRMRARAAARALGGFRPEASLAVLSALARDGGVDARVALVAVAQAFSDPDPELPYGWRADLYRAAVGAGAAEVAALLLSPPPLRAFQEPLDKPDPRLAHLTLGHKKAYARARRDPDLLARLAAEGDPVVVRELLRNPQLTEAFVVRIAARRPCRPATLRCVYESRWRTRPAVALAVTRNPYAEPEIATKMLTALSPPDLGEVARDPTVHPLVRGLAERLQGRGRAAASSSGEGLAALGAGAGLAALAATLDEPADGVAPARDARGDEHEQRDEGDDESDLDHGEGP